MSIHARGIVLTADFDTIVLQATPEDVRRFVKGAHVDVVDDRELRRHIAEHAHPFHSKGPCVAVLKTICGCERKMAIQPGNPPRYIRVPIVKRVSVFTNDAAPNFAERTFKLERVAAEDIQIGSGPGPVFSPKYLYAEYYEVTK
jgi:hypothetical protein